MTEKTTGWRLLGKGIASVPQGTWGGVAATAFGFLLAAVGGVATTDGAVRWFFGITAAVAVLVSLFAVVAWLWTGPVFAPWREERERLRVAAEVEAKHAAVRPMFEEAFNGWPEFRCLTSTLFSVLTLEEDRMNGHKREGPGWPEFLDAATAARTAAAESIWERWRQDAVAVLTPLAEFREPIDFKTVQLPMARLDEGKGVGE
jgi:hypothetical protein